MENPCYKCAQTVEEGVPFCPHCSAPQIRVVLAEPAPQPLAFAATTSPDSAALPASQTIPVLALPMQWSQALRPCALAAMIGTLLIFLGLFPFVATFCVGVLAVISYRQRSPGTRVKAGIYVKLGALAGILCSGIISSLFALAVTVPEIRTKMQEQSIEGAQRAAAWFPGNPSIQALMDQLKTPQGFVNALIAWCVVLFVLSALAGSLGGALGGAILGRRDKS
jgi:hypothetical protein